MKIRLAVAVGLLASSAAAAAPKVPDSCAVASTKAVAEERAGHLRAAHALYASCAKATCGPKIGKQCADGLEMEVPTIVPTVTDENGVAMNDVEVWMERDLLASKLDGKPIAVDPGLHEFSFSANGEVIATRKIVVLDAQRNRPIAITLGAPHVAAHVAPVVVPEVKPASPPETVKVEGSRGALPWLFAGTGVVGVGSGVLLTYWGRKDNDALAQCSPNCAHSSLTHIRTLYLAADVSAGIGVVALGLATWLFARPRPAVEKRLSALRVTPLPAGGAASIAGTF